jgi:OOP family OmpA-OmpF porin
MKTKHSYYISLLFLVSMLTTSASAIEVMVNEELVRVADNAIFLIDTSSSMNEDFRDGNASKRELVEREFTKRNGGIPDLGFKFGIYTYTDWEEFYPLQPYDREKVAAALDEIAKKGPGPTPIKKALENLEDILKTTSGRTAVFVFSDGEYTGGSPREIAHRLATSYDVCFYVISTAKEAQNNSLQQSVADLNSCSRMIPLEAYLDQPEYQSGALYVNVATTGGAKVDSSNFAFDQSELQNDAIAELDQLAVFMAENPDSYAVLSGYTDNTGPEEYNEGLSRRRTEAVALYMIENHDIDKNRMVLQWYGSDNPVASNDSREGRATNRRVEIAVGGV